MFGRKKWDFEESSIPPYYYPPMANRPMSVSEFLANKREEKAELEALEDYFKKEKDKEKDKHKQKDATAQEKRELALIMFLLSPIPGFAILHMLAFMYHHLPKF